MPGRLEGKVAVVTGGAGGIGRETARRFAEEGARVCIADLADEPGQETASEVDGIYVHADVTDPDDVQRMYSETAERFGGIDVLFNNAGISPPDDDSILETGLEAWERVQNVNLKSVYLCCKYGIPHLLERGGGSIINTASFVAVMGAATSQISYTASKGGVLALSRELGVEFARQGDTRQRALPWPGEYTAFAGDLRQGPGESGAQARAPADGPVRGGDGDRGRRPLPGLRRRLLRQRLDLPG